MAFSDKIQVCLLCDSIFRLALSQNSVTVTNSVLIIPELAQPNYQPLKIFSGIYITYFASLESAVGRIIPKYLKTVLSTSYM